MQHKSLLSWALFFITLLPASAQYQKPLGESVVIKNFKPVIKRLDSLVLKKMQEYNVLGLSIALVDDQSVIWSKGFGYTDNSKIRKVDQQTLFSTQSISKTYTATAFLMEVSEGKFNLDDKASAYYPNLNVRSRHGNNEAEKITFRQLLSHRAGFCQEAPLGNNYDTLHCTFDEHIKSINGSWLRFSPGTFYSYSNIGPDIIGYILSKKANLTIDKYLKEKVLSPIGMINSTYNQDEAYNFKNIARGYLGDKEIERTFIGDIAAGSLYSSASEMAKFLMFQFNKYKINGRTSISPELIAQMQTVQFKLDQQVASYGLGVMLKPFHGGTLVYHPGGGYGYKAVHAWIPEAKIGVVVLTNDGIGTPLINEIYETALQEILKVKSGSLPPTKLPPVNIPVVEISKEKLKKLVGTYKTNKRIVELILVKNRLLTVSAHDTILLSAHSESEFSSDDGNRYLFYFNKAGLPTHFINVNHNDADFYIFNDYPNEKSGIIQPSWKKLVGSYKGFNNRQVEIIKVFFKNGYLYSSLGGATKMTEFKPGIFFTSDGESVIKKNNTLYLGNRAYTQQ